MDITTYEKDILRVLLKRRSWLNTTQIAELTDMSWNTAVKYLQRMYNRGWLSRSGNYWKVKK